ncbi:MAG: flippase-like domain-containing protein [Saprospiraceae bacterium]|nr:flippase-like domain-containing protein [Saprospiraceae bacterium]
MIGVGVVVYLFFQQFDPKEFAKIQWSTQTDLLILLALIFLATRIISYAYRLKVLSDNVFSLSKSIELIFIWEFSSAVSPTNVGGSAVALFILSQEKIGAAKTATIVIYTIVLDTIFYLVAVPLWVIVFGSNVVGPGRTSIQAFGGWEITLLIAYSAMLLYGSFFFYGLFFRPDSLQKLANLVARLPFLRKYRAKLIQIGEDVKITSRELKTKSWSYHLKALLFTIAAWSSRYLIIICLIAAVGSVSMGIPDFFELFSRIQVMFVMMAFSPTPGGAGFAELLFGGLLSDFVPTGISLVIAMLWRILDYYFFLIMGVIIIPQWLSKILKRRREKRHQEEETQGNIKR